MRKICPGDRTKKIGSAKIPGPNTMPTQVSGSAAIRNVKEHNSRDRFVPANNRSARKLFPAHALGLLIGMELDQFSVNADALLKIKKIIRSISFAEAQDIAQQALSYASASETKAFISDLMEKYAAQPSSRSRPS